MDAHITTNLKKLLDEKQPAVVIESIIICINRLGRSLKKGAPEFVLKAREKYIRTMLDFYSFRKYQSKNSCHGMSFYIDLFETSSSFRFTFA